MPHDVPVAQDSAHLFRTASIMQLRASRLLAALLLAVVRSLMVMRHGPHGPHGPHEVDVDLHPDASDMTPRLMIS